MKGIDILIEKLDVFIRKYYKNKLLKGGIYSSALLCSFFLTFILLEYFGQFDVFGRSILFYSYLCFASLVLVFYVIIPLFKLARLGKIISYEQAAKIVGNHFGDVKDKILNTLQLNENKDKIPTAQLSLVSASIDQRVSQLNSVSFTSAIDFRDNKKYVKFLLAPLIILLIISFTDVSIITNSTSNLINHNTYIAPVAPFNFEIQNKDLEVVQQEDFSLSVKVVGNHIPNSIYINVDGRKHKLNKISNVEFEYNFRNVNSNATFYLSAENINSEEYVLKTIPKPSLMGFILNLDYPEYTKLKDEELRNIGDLSIPAGTKMNWSFNTKNTDNISLRFKDTLIELIPKGENSFIFSKQMYESSNYSISTKNKYIINDDSISYFLEVVKDANPAISVQESLDSNNFFMHYFKGNISDDYGFTKLSFKYSKIKEGKATESKAIDLPLSKNYNSEQFFHYFDVSQLELKPGEAVEYYFVVWDNDGINGPKSSRSQTKIYKAPTLNELADKADKSNQNIKDELSKNLKEAQKLQDELKQIQKNLLEKQNPDWQDKNRLEEFIKKQQSLENKINELKQENNKKNSEQNEFKPLSEEILKKQQQLNELFEELMTDEMKELYKELQKMLEEMNKNQLLNKMEEIELSQEQMEKELDRSLEQFKRMEFESKLDDITNRLDELAKKQEELSEETKDKEKSNFQLNKEQEKLNEEFENIQEEIDDLEKLNEELEQKKNLLDTEEEEKEIEKKMEESQEGLEEKKNKKASEKQKEASDDMKKLSQMMKNMKSKEEQEQQGEDMDALRQLLENLIQFSFEQEEVMNQLKGLNPKDPMYVKLGQRQRKLEDDAELLEDSLFALSKRVMQLSPYINKEVAEMNKNIASAVKHIADRQTPMATSKQQYVMTATNNLALLFDEAIKQMQEAMNNSQPGSGECNKPGGKGKGKPSAQSMKEMQKQLEKQLQKMKEAMQKGDNPGGKEDGKTGDGGKNPGGKDGQGGMGGMSSKEIAQMAAEQSALRKQIEQMAQELNKDGSGNGNGLKQIAKDLESVEEDLVNKRISNETMLRQKDIMTRLLQHEKAQRERELDNKREANEAKDQLFSNPNEYLEYKQKKEREIEMLKTIPPSLKPYYKNKVNEYFNQIDE